MSRKAISASLCGLSQGMIFNAVPFKNFLGYGVVVTAECDLANRKSKTIHYIAISPIKNYFCDNFCETMIHTYVNSLCKNNGLDLEYIKMCIFHGLDYGAGKIKNELNQLLNIDKKCNEQCFIKEHFGKQAIQKIDEIIFDKITHLYYMHDIGLCNNKGYIIDFHDIRSISLSIAEEIVNGIECEPEIENYKNSGLSGRDGVIMPIGVMTSPQREHFLQRFSHSFARIGLPDIEKSTAERLIKSF